MTSKHRVPDTWIVTQVKDVVESIDYGLTASANESPSGPRFLRITDIQNGRVNWDAVPSCDLRSKDVERYRLVDGDLVFARTGATTGKSFLIRNCPDRAVFASYLIRLRASAILDPRFLALCFQTADYWRQISETSTGTAQPGVNATKLNELWLSVAPEGEQRRIVEAVESYFTRLDDTVATLERVERNLKRYRASVLKAAVEGRLVPTEAALAKEEGRSYEPASVLLERILTERRRRWSESSKKRKYEEPVRPDTTNLPDLPQGWCWATVDQLIIEDLANGRSVPTATAGFPVLRLTALKDGGIDLAERKIGAWTRGEAEPYLVREGDFLVARGNGSIRLVGRGGLLRHAPDEVAYPDTLIRIRLGSGILSELLGHFWHSRWVRDQIEKKAKTTAGIYKVNQTDLGECVIPLMPLHEQYRLLEEIERQTSVITANEESVLFALSRVTRLRQSILKWAFEGKLADQDANDEPAPGLLERIKAERGRSKALMEATPLRTAKEKQVRG